MISKRVFAIICTLMCMSFMFSVVALAANHDFDPITVTVGGGWKTVPDSNSKSDSEQKAYVTITSKSNSSLVYARVIKASNSKVYTGEKSISSTGTYTIPYTIYAGTGTAMKLQFQGTTQNQTLKGRWCS